MEKLSNLPAPVAVNFESENILSSDSKNKLVISYASASVDSNNNNIVLGDRKDGSLKIESSPFNRMVVLDKITSTTEFITSKEDLLRVIKNAESGTAYLPDCLVEMEENAFVSTTLITKVSIPKGLSVTNTGIANTTVRE